MDIIRSTQATRRQNSPVCVAIEYEFPDENAINVATIELTGRYPETGFARNNVCTEIISIIKGEGALLSKDGPAALVAGDTVRISPLEAYALEGTMILSIASSPAWYPEQYETITR